MKIHEAITMLANQDQGKFLKLADWNVQIENKHGRN